VISTEPLPSNCRFFAEPFPSNSCLRWLHNSDLSKYVTIFIVFQEESGDDDTKVKEEMNIEVKVQKNEMRSNG
jgi:hypothetical protein